MSLLWALALAAAMPTATDQRINLADFARVVKFVNDTPSTLDVQDLETGADGWPVWTGEDGQSMIGLEWDEPRDIAEAEIEFRHAIADRDQIRIQYFLSDAATTQPGGATTTPDTFHGRWVTAKAEWWAGDRYVGFAFAPMNEELPNTGATAITYRRTCRLRFALGKRKDELPGVRYLRAYGPSRAVEAKLEVRLDKLSALRSPLRIQAVNGVLVDEEGETTRAGSLENAPMRMRVRFADKDLSSPSRTIVTLTDESNGPKGFSFLPAEVVERGIVGVPSLGVSVVHVGSTKDLSARSKPTTAVFDRLKTGSAPAFESVWEEVTGSGATPVSPLTPEYRKLAATRYRDILGRAMAIEVPVPLLNEFYQAQLVQLLASADPGSGAEALSPDTFSDSVRPVASCAEARALDVVGLPEAAEAFLNDCLRLEPAPKPIGRFGARSDGFLSTRRLGGERFDRSTQEHGVLLELMGEHYRITRDRRWLARNASRLKAACDFVIRQSKVDKDNNTLDKDDVFWGEGLLPPGPITGTTAWAWWLTANAWCARGMRATVDALAEVNEPGVSALAGQVAGFEQQVARSCREAMLRCPVVALADAEHAPMQPIRSRFREREPDVALAAVHGAVHLIDCGVYASDSQEAGWILRDTEDNVWPTIGMAMSGRAAAASARNRFLEYGGQSPAGPPAFVPVYLQRGEHRQALKAFYGLLAAELARKVPTDRSSKRAADEDIGATLLTWLRALLVREQGRELHLLAGVPADWLAKGRSIKLQRVPTWFGPVDLAVDSAADANRIMITLVTPMRQAPAAVRLWVRAPQQLLTVTCNGQRLATFDPASGLIRLPANEGRMEIVVTY